MTFATRLTKVRYRSEHFDERTGMCYHQAPPSERVVVHVRDAGQAKPPLEHNPLSLLGACYATPRRQLNDPAKWSYRMRRRTKNCWNCLTMWKHLKGSGKGWNPCTGEKGGLPRRCFSVSEKNTISRMTHDHLPRHHPTQCRSRVRRRLSVPLCMGTPSRCPVVCGD